MSNPDTNSFWLSIPFGIFFAFLIIVLFTVKLLPLFYIDSYLFKIVLYIGMPIVAFIMASIVNIVSQLSNCKKIDAGKAFLGGIPSFITVLIALGISTIKIFRIPVASVFTPIIGDMTPTNSLKNSKSKECCNPQFSLTTIESHTPLIKGISYGFYSMFAIFYGIVIGNSYATIC